MIRIIDQHVHTKFSPDSDADLRELIERAISLGLETVVITDHLEYASNDFVDEVPIDYDEVFPEIEALQKEYPNIELRVGTELGYVPRIKQQLSDTVNKYNFDIVISSLHDGDEMSFYNGDFFLDRTQEESYKRYFEIMYEMVTTFDDFDVVGHLDYIMRYGNPEVNTLDYYAHKEEIDEILRVIIARGKGIEINTSGLTHYELGTFHPQKEILQTYFNLGGTIITIGSDAHQVRRLTEHFELVKELLLEIGFTEYTEFKNRVPKQIKL